MPYRWNTDNPFTFYYFLSTGAIVTGGGGVLIIMHGRSHMTIGPRIPMI